MNCSFMPRALRAARLSEVECLVGGTGPPQSGEPSLPQPGQSRRKASEALGGPPRRKRTRTDSLSTKVDQLSSELAQMKSLLLSLRPTVMEDGSIKTPPMPDLAPEEDIISVAASAALFNDDEGGEGPSHASESGSRSSVHGSVEGSDDGSMGSIIRMALARLHLDSQQSDQPPA